MAEVSPRPVLHYEAFCIFFLSTKCRVIPPEWAFSTIFKPLFELFVAQGIFFKWLRAAPGHGSSFSTRFRGFFASVRFAQTLPEMGGDVKPPNAWFSALAVGSKLFFSKMLTYKRAYSGVKITIMRTRPDPNRDLSHFPIRPKTDGDRGCTRFQRLWSFSNFARG